MQSGPSISARVDELFQATWALSALVVGLERGLVQALPGRTADLAALVNLDAALVERILDVLRALEFVERLDGVWSAAPGLAVTNPRILLADLRATLGVQRHLAERARELRELTGWPGDDPVIVRAQGVASEAQTAGMIHGFLPRLDGLVEQLERPGAAVLDAGAGAAGFCIAMARRFPLVRVVGLEPAPLALAEARHNVDAAGLADRIELRPDAIEALSDGATFDAAYVAQMFMPDEALRAGMKAVHRSLKPGGWLLTGAISGHGDDLGAAIARLRNTVWGGGSRTADELVELVRDAGFSDVRTAAGPPGSRLVPVLARRSRVADTPR